VPGNPDASLLIKAVGYKDDALRMPPSGKLSEREISALVEWVKLGAPDPRSGEPASTVKQEIDIAEGKKHWAFQPLHPGTPSAVKNAAWCRTPIDRFILAALEAKGIAPNPIADRRKLIRRAYFDLIGLPPSLAEVEAFVKDREPDAYGKLLDRLLASNHHGERWGRHWLDLARFGESHGFEHDSSGS
jgi:hypothetical protein